MLYEFRNVRQVPEEGFRRWFVDADLDLIVWYPDDTQSEINGFQLCYNKARDQKALTWYRDRGFYHNRIDDGESSPLRNRTPILVADGHFPKSDVLESFRTAASELEPELTAYVISVLERYPEAL